MCSHCRRRKIACDRGAPCGQCVQAQLECTYYNSHAHSNSHLPVDRRNSARFKYRPSSSASSMQAVLYPRYGSESTLSNVNYRSHVFDSEVAPAPLGPVSIDMSAPDWFDADLVNTSNQFSTTPTDPTATILFSPDQGTSLLDWDASPETGHPALLPPPVSCGSFAAEPGKALFLKSRMYGPTHWMTILHKVNITRRLSDVPSWLTWEYSLVEVQ